MTSNSDNLKDIIQTIRLDRISKVTKSSSRWWEVDPEPEASPHVRFEVPPTKQGMHRFVSGIPVQKENDPVRPPSETMKHNQLNNVSSSQENLEVIKDSNSDGVPSSVQSSSESTYSGYREPIENLRSEVRSLYQVQGQLDRILSDYGGSRPYCYLKPFFKVILTRAT